MICPKCKQDTLTREGYDYKCSNCGKEFSALSKSQYRRMDIQLGKKEEVLTNEEIDNLAEEAVNRIIKESFEEENKNEIKN